MDTIEQSPPYQQTLNYPAYLQYRLNQITNVNDMGYSGYEELKTLWKVLITEVKTDLLEEYNKKTEMLTKSIEKEQLGTIFVNKEKRYMTHQERVYKLESAFVDEMIGKIIDQLNKKKLLLITGKEVEVGGTYG